MVKHVINIVLYGMMFGLLVMVVPIAYSYGKHNASNSNLADAKIGYQITDASITVATDKPMGNGCDATVYAYLENEHAFIALDVAHFPPDTLQHNVTWGIDDHVPPGEYVLSIFVKNECNWVKKKVPLTPVKVHLGDGV